MLKSIIHFTAFVCLSASLFADSTDIDKAISSKPVDGFSWVKILDDRSALLKPDGWFFREDHKEGVDAYFITKEEIKGGSLFKTGLSLNVIYNIKEKSKHNPSIYAAALAEQTRKLKPDTVIDISGQVRGPFYMLIHRFRDSKGGPPIIVHNLYIANDTTSTLWLFIFESPEDEWEKAWENFGDTIIKHLYLETEI